MTQCVLIPRDAGKSADVLKFNPLEDAAPSEVVPASWNAGHVSKRMTEAFETLIEMPTGGLSKKSGFWPAYSYEWEDLLAQQEQEDEEKSKAQRALNRSRLAPSIEQISRMERALYWPAEYLIDRPPFMRAVNALAFAHALDRDAHWIVRKRGGNVRRWQRHHWQGCNRIALELNRGKVAVF